MSYIFCKFSCVFHIQEGPNLSAYISTKEYQDVIDGLSEFISKTFAANAPSKGSYEFDPDTYSWTHKKTLKVTKGK